MLLTFGVSIPCLVLTLVLVVLAWPNESGVGPTASFVLPAALASILASHIARRLSPAPVTVR
jgi:hypothetical protein